jgi:tetratricopeptide (TPR) repeat protein
MLLLVFSGLCPAKTAAAAPSGQQAPAAAPAKDSGQPKPASRNDRRRAARLYLQASKLFEQEQFEEAMDAYLKASALDPANVNYQLAAGLARSHAVTALVQAAAKDRLRGDAAASLAALERARVLDPKNVEVTEHLYELSDDALLGQSTPIYERGASTLGEPVKLAPVHGVHSFHLRTDQHHAIQEVFRTYGLEATVDESIQNKPIRLDADDADFMQAMRTLSLLTKSFYVPLDEHRVLVARDTGDLRKQYQRTAYETVSLPGLSKTDLTEVGNLAKNVFEIQEAQVQEGSGTLTVRGPQRALNALNFTLRDLLAGRSQVLLDVRLIQIAHTNELNTGVNPPQQFTAINAYSEEQSLLNSNQSLVQQIVSSGLAAPGDTLAILGILLASGQVSSSLFTNGIALFGGGLTLSGLSPGPATVNLSLNSSDSHELDRLQLRLGDGEAGTVSLGERYPIQTSSFSSLSPSLPNIPGLTGAGSSGSLSSLLSSYASSVPNIPQVEYQDLGMNLKATPKVMRDNDVALTIDMKIDALAGSSLNGNPILNNRAYSGVVTLKAGEGVVIISDLNKSESHAISGTPGISEIPGLNDITSKDTQKSYATLLIVMTPHVIRGTQPAGHSPMMRVEKGSQAR